MTQPDATVDGIKHAECWLLSCRVCGPIGVANTVSSAHIEARAHLQVHGVTGIAGEIPEDQTNDGSG